MSEKKVLMPNKMGSVVDGDMFLVFYNRDGYLHQVTLTHEQVMMVGSIISAMHEGSIKVSDTPTMQMQLVQGDKE